MSNTRLINQASLKMNEDILDIRNVICALSEKDLVEVELSSEDREILFRKGIGITESLYSSNMAILEATNGE